MLLLPKYHVLPRTAPLRCGVCPILVGQGRAHPGSTRPQHPHRGQPAGLRGCRSAPAGPTCGSPAQSSRGPARRIHAGGGGVWGGGVKSASTRRPNRLARLDAAGHAGRQPMQPAALQGRRGAARSQGREAKEACNVPRNRRRAAGSAGSAGWAHLVGGGVQADRHDRLALLAELAHLRDEPHRRHSDLQTEDGQSTAGGTKVGLGWGARCMRVVGRWPQLQGRAPHLARSVSSDSTQGGESGFF